jgi:hypothetical protein
MALFDTSLTKNDSGAVMTMALFYELSYDNHQHVIFTLKDHDIELPNGRPAVALSQKFIDLCTMDPTEYEFAQVIFGSWDVWERISNSPKLAPHVKRWRKEATIRRKAMAFKAVISEVSEGGRSSFTAAKYLIEENWVDQGQSTDGRAARKKVKETASKAYERVAAQDDLKRLREEGLIN